MTVTEQHCGELSVNGSETCRLNFPENTQGLPKLMEGKYLDNVYFRLLVFFFFFTLLILFSSTTLPRVTSSLVVRMLSDQVIINSDAFWVAQTGYQLCSLSVTELAFLSIICLSV